MNSTLKSLLTVHSGTVDEKIPNDQLLRDREFHLALAGLSGRKVQLQMLQHLFDLLYLKYRGSLLFIQSKDPVGSEHQNIFNAVVSHDVEAAITAMQGHFTKIRAQALKSLGRMIASTTSSG